MKIEIKEKIDQLFKQPTWLEKVSGKESKTKKSLINEIGLSGEFEAIIPLATVMISQADLYAHCLRAIKSLLRTINLKKLVTLELRFRASHWTYNQEWHQISPKRLSHMIDGSEDDALILGLMSFHASGYVREEAVKLLSKIKSGREIPFLVLRTNDWVFQVRKAAEKTIKGRLKIKNIDKFKGFFWLISRMESQGRASESGVSGEFKRLYFQNIDDIKIDLENEDFLTRREIVKWFPDAKMTEQLIKICLRDKDCLVRSYALNFLEKNPDLRAALLPELVSSPFKNVRSKTVYFLIGREDAAENLRVLAFDKAKRVRESAVFYLKRITEFDAREQYLSRIPEVLAVEGLGDCGKKEDVDLLLDLISSENRKVRIAALRSIGRIFGEDREEFFKQCLDSGFDDVVATSVKQLIRMDASIDTVFLASKLINCRENVFQNIVKLTKILSRFQGILVLLEIWNQIPGEKHLEIVESKLRLVLKENGPIYLSKDEDQKLNSQLSSNSKIPLKLREQILLKCVR